MHSRISLPFGALLLTLAALLGCNGGSGVKPVSVSGVITVNGEPLANAEINFITDEFAGYGKTDAQGRYALVQGAAPGDNKITINKILKVEGMEYSDNPEDGLDEGQMAAASGVPGPGGPGGGKSAEKQLPPEYSDIANTKLTFKVPEDGSEAADFRLTINE